MERDSLVKCRTERRSTKRAAKPKMQDTFVKRKIIGVSDYPKPYKNTESDQRNNYKAYLATDRKREHSVERYRVSFI